MNRLKILKLIIFIIEKKKNFLDERINARATSSAVSLENKSSSSLRSRDTSSSRVHASTGARSRDYSTGSRSHSRQRESGGSPRRNSGSPRLPRPRSEEIPLEDMKLKVFIIKIYTRIFF